MSEHTPGSQNRHRGQHVAGAPVPDGAGRRALPAAEGRAAWHRLALFGRPRATLANLLITVLALLLGFAIAAQVHQTQAQGLDTLREDDLVRILDTVNQDGARLEQEISTLQASRDRLQSGATSREEALAAAKDRLVRLGILTGTVPAVGPGINLTIHDADNKITAPVLLDTLQELRDAGAEAVQVNDIRVVASTYFTDGDTGIEVSGRPIQAPYVFIAIGDSQTLASAMDIPGGVSESVRSLGGDTVVTPQNQVTVSALHTLSPPEYAQPVPTPTPTSSP
jgi:uncharacterized protein YlxW (UPF0749 family)